MSAMTQTINRSLILLCLGLSLTACAGYQPLEANCFTFPDAPASAASAASTATTTTATISTMGAEVTRRDTECEFVMLGTGG